MRTKLIPSNISKRKEAALIRQLGESIRYQRDIRGLTQLGLALEAGLSKSYLCDVEKGRRNPSFTIVCRIAKALGIEPSELLSDVKVVPIQK